MGHVAPPTKSCAPPPPHTHTHSLTIGLPQRCLASVLLLLLPVIFPAPLLPLPLFSSYFLSSFLCSFPLQPPRLPFSCHLGSFLLLPSVTTSLCPTPTPGLKLFPSFLLASDFFPPFFRFRWFCHWCDCLPAAPGRLYSQKTLFCPQSRLQHVNLVV